MRIIHKEQVYMEVDKERGDKEGGGLEYTEFHLRKLLFLFNARVYFVQEYIYPETAGRVVFHM